MKEKYNKKYRVVGFCARCPTHYFQHLFTEYTLLPFRRLITPITK